MRVDVMLSVEKPQVVTCNNSTKNSIGTCLCHCQGKRGQRACSTATGKRDINLYVLAWMVVGLFFALVGLLMFVVLSEANVSPVNQLFGAMATGFGMVLQYFFGSSKGSAEKTAAIVELKELAETVGKK